jgi:hypothetical protein
MACPSGTISHGMVSGETGCTYSVRCDTDWNRPKHYRKLYDQCYTFSGTYVGDYYAYTSFEYCC